METEIADLRKKLNQPGTADNTLDQLLALADKREQYARDLATAKSKAEQERKDRDAEMARLKAPELASRKKKFEEDYAKYNTIAESSYLDANEKRRAWELICGRWGIGAGKDPSTLHWDPESGKALLSPPDTPLQSVRPGVMDICLGDGITMSMVYVPRGRFTKGSPTEITEGFWIGKYEVTQEQWSVVMGRNPSRFKGPKNPVESVDWETCQQYLKKLNELGVWGTFRLPTGKEWEYACRAGTETDLNAGRDLTQLGGICPNLEKVAWYDQNSGKRTHPVGKKKANAWGIHDMHGNVSELCWEEETDPLFAIMDAAYQRGGSWCDGKEDCRSASGRTVFLGFEQVRSGDSGFYEDGKSGFRLVLVR